MLAIVSVSWLVFAAVRITASGSSGARANRNSAAGTDSSANAPVHVSASTSSGSSPSRPASSAMRSRRKIGGAPWRRCGDGVSSMRPIARARN